jgi:protein gp37
VGETTGIGWTDHTFSPWWGCAKVSPGCSNCYAETWAGRWGHDVWGATKPRRVFGEKHWREPRKWNAEAEHTGVRRRVFCASMADVFEDHPTANVERPRLWELVADTPWLDWQLLTKRPENIMGATMLPWGWPLPNVWLGVSVEDQRRADERIPVLCRVSAAVRFLSCEPLLGPLDLSDHLGLEWMDALRPPGAPVSFRGEGGWGAEMFASLRGDVGGGLDWAIIGGETGPHRRPMDVAWLADIADQCSTAGLAVFVKQDAGPRPGMQGRIPEALWTRNELPR